MAWHTGKWDAVGNVRMAAERAILVFCCLLALALLGLGVEVFPFSRPDNKRIDGVQKRESCFPF